MAAANRIRLSDLSSQDRSLLEQLYRVHSRTLARYISSRCQGAGIDPEDIVQMAFMRLASMADFSHVENMLGYVAWAVRNTLNDQLRHVQAQRRTLGEPISDLSNDCQDLPYHSTPEDILSAQETLNRVETVLARMPARRRQLFLAYRLDGQTVRNLALQYGIPRSTVGDHVATATRACQKALQS